MTNEFNFEVLDLGLVYYKNIIPNPENLIEVINKTNNRFLENEHKNAFTNVKDWTPWSYGDTIFSWQKFFPEPKDIPSLDYYYQDVLAVSEVLYSSLEKAFNHYVTEIYPFAKNNIKGREESIHLLRYGPGGHLPAHQDQGVSSRVLSSVMYLNDSYVGGEIEFINSGVRLKPKAGSIIFFPSNFLYVHEVHPIDDGYRYSMPHWYHNISQIIHSDGTE